MEHIFKIKSIQPLGPHVHRMLPEQHHGYFQGASWTLPNSENSQDKGSSHWALQGAKEPHKGMDNPNVIVDRLLVGKTSPTTLHQTIIVLGGGTYFSPLKILTVGVQV